MASTGTRPTHIHINNNKHTNISQNKQMKPEEFLPKVLEFHLTFFFFKEMGAFVVTSAPSSLIF